MDDEQSLVPYGPPIRYVFGDWTAQELADWQDRNFSEAILANPASREWMLRMALKSLTGEDVQVLNWHEALQKRRTI